MKGWNEELKKKKGLEGDESYLQTQSGSLLVSQMRHDEPPNSVSEHGCFLLPIFKQTSAAHAQLADELANLGEWEQQQSFPPSFSGQRFHSFN